MFRSTSLSQTDGRLRPAGRRQFDADPTAKIGDSNLMIGIRYLILAQSDAQHLDAILSSRVKRQAAPTAADVQQAVARLEPQLAADVFQFALLRGIKVFRARRARCGR